jgi:hypothetical protein
MLILRRRKKEWVECSAGLEENAGTEVDFLMAPWVTPCDYGHFCEW